MANRHELDSERLDESSARRLLERATELDARLATESTVADLRDAARAAGISEEAFNRALAEVRQPVQPEAPPVVSKRSMGRRVAIAAAVAGTLALLAFFRAQRHGADIDHMGSAARATPAAPPAQMPVVPPPEYHRSAPPTPRPR